jgi:hypothetical protein
MVRTTTSPIRRIAPRWRMAGGSLAERHDAHQRGDAHAHPCAARPRVGDRAFHCYFVALVSITPPVGIWPSLGCTVTGTTVASR